MFIGPDGTPINSQEDWNRQGEWINAFFSGLGLTDPVTDLLIEKENVCAESYSDIFFASDFTLLPKTEEIGEQADEINFWNLLVTTMPQTPYLPYPNETIDILDVGCGQALGAMSLHSYFGHSVYPHHGKNVTYVGIDIDEVEIARATDLHKERPDLRFAVADATDLTQIISTMSQEVQTDGFDVVVIRHQNASNPPDVWRSIFSEAWDRLKVGGILFVTSYTCLEHDIMVNDMFELGVAPWLNGRNPHATMSLKSDDTTGLLKRDNYVAVFWKDLY